MQARENLATAIILILEDRGEDKPHDVPAEAVRETNTLKSSGVTCPTTLGGTTTSSRGRIDRAL